MSLLHSLFSNRKNILLLFLLILILVTPLVSYPFVLLSDTVGKRFYFLTVMGIGITGVSFLSKKNKKLRLKPIDLILWVFGSYIVLNYILKSNHSISYIEFWTYIGYWLCGYLFRVLWKYYGNDQLFFKLFCWIIISIASFQSILGLLQYTRLILIDSEYYELLGTFINPNVLGAYLAFSIIITMGYLQQFPARKKIVLAGWILWFSLIGIVLFLTQSRAAWLALIVGGLMYIVIQKRILSGIKKIPYYKILIPIAMSCVLITGGILLYKLNPDSVQGRLLIAKLASVKGMEKPITGHGVCNFTNVYNTEKASYFLSQKRPWDEIKVADYVSSAFNDYLLLFFETGWIGVLFFLLGLFFLVKNIVLNPQSKVALAILPSILTLALFTTPFSNPSLMIFGIWAVSTLIVFGKTNGILIMDLGKWSNRGIWFANFILGTALLFFVLQKTYYWAAYKSYLVDKVNQKDKAMELYAHLNSHPYPQFALGQDLYDANYKKEGLKAMETAILKEGDPELNRTLAINYIKEKEFEKAKLLLDRNMGLEPFKFKPKADMMEFLALTNQTNQQKILAQEIIDLPIKVPSPEITKYKERARNFLQYQNGAQDKNKVPQYPDFALQGTFIKNQIIESAILDKKLYYNIYLPSKNFLTGQLPVIYVNDGPGYIIAGNMLQTLDRMIQSGKMQPVIAVFIDPRKPSELDNNLRNQLFLCNASYVDFFTQELTKKIESKYPASPNNRTILGCSFGGLFAAYLGLEAPEEFGNIAMQSPAFHTCKELYTRFEKLPKQNLKIYLSYGTKNDTERQDLPMIDILKRKKYEAKVNRVENGEHDWRSWKDQIEDILLYFYKA